MDEAVGDLAGAPLPLFLFQRVDQLDRREDMRALLRTSSFRYQQPISIVEGADP